MGTYIDSTSVRRTCGIAAAEISDVDVDATIAEVEKQVPRYFNTVFVPTEVIEIQDGTGTNRLLLENNPVLGVRELKIDGTAEDTANLEVSKQSGYIWLGSSADTSTFKTGRNEVVVKYIYGSVIHSTTASTTTSAAEVAGTAVSVGVVASSSFAEDDWVEIVGMDGMREVAQISSITDATTIVLDKLVLGHESGSTVVKLEIDTNFKKCMNLVAGIACIARIIGQSYSDTVGYDLGELHVQKGEPYTQWRETANQFIKERDDLMRRIGIRPQIL